MDRAEEYELIELPNSNTALRIVDLQPLKSTRKRKAPSVSSLWTKRRRQEYNLGSLECLGEDVLSDILNRVDAQTLLNCAAVNNTMLNIITSSDFRRSWHAKPGVLIGSWALPWRLWTGGEAPDVFQALNTISRPFKVLASAGGLVCISLQRDILELAVGNPLTREWVKLPIPEVDAGPKSPLKSVTMEVTGRQGQFKVGVRELLDCSYRYYVYDSVSDTWGVTELHYPPLSVYKWSVYDLAHSCWRTDLFSSWEIKTGLERQPPEEEHRLSPPRFQCFINWEYKGTSYFASPWTCDVRTSFAGYGVWKVDDKGELVHVAAVCAEDLALHRAALGMNDGCGLMVSCNAAANLVCYMGESPFHPAMPVVVYDLETEQWTPFEAPTPDASDYFSDCEELIYMLEWDKTKAFEHYTVAVVYSPSLLAPAADQRRDGGKEASRRYEL